MDHEERPSEQEAVRTTIVGGRPPGSGKAVGPIPRGIEVLVKKAAVDPDFKQVLMAKRADAAYEINLKLEPAEIAMLNAVPPAQLDTIIANTEVADLSRAAFLGRAAAVMLAALGVSTMDTSAQEGPPVTGSRPDPTPPKPDPKPDKDDPKPEPDPDPDPKPEPPKPVTRGVRPDTPVSKGIRPDKPEPKPEPPKPPPEPTSRGIRPDRPEPTPSKGVRPDRPQTRGIRPKPTTPPTGLTAAQIKKRVDAMVALLGNPEYNVRVEAKQALLGMGPAALPALKAAKPPTFAAENLVKTIIEAIEADALKKK